MNRPWPAQYRAFFLYLSKDVQPGNRPQIFISHRIVFTALTGPGIVCAPKTPRSLTTFQEVVLDRATSVTASQLWFVHPSNMIPLPAGHDCLEGMINRVQWTVFVRVGISAQDL
jgi:hypothetical protein